MWSFLNLGNSDNGEKEPLLSKEKSQNTYSELPPPEILQLIISNVEDPLDLPSLAQASKGLRQAVLDSKTTVDVEFVDQRGVKSTKKATYTQLKTLFENRRQKIEKIHEIEPSDISKELAKPLAGAVGGFCGGMGIVGAGLVIMFTVKTLVGVGVGVMAIPAAASCGTVHHLFRKNVAEREAEAIKLRNSLKNESRPKFMSR